MTVEKRFPNLPDTLRLAAQTNVLLLFARNPAATPVQVVETVLGTLDASGYDVTERESTFDRQAAAPATAPAEKDRSPKPAEARTMPDDVMP